MVIILSGLSACAEFEAGVCCDAALALYLLPSGRRALLLPRPGERER